MEKVLPGVLRNILEEAEQGSNFEPSSRESLFEDEPICEDTGTPCWHLQEASQFIAEDFAEVTGIDAEILSIALTEAMKCDSGCGAKYKTEKGDFKGGKGVAFQNCEKYAQECCSGVKDPSAFCAYLGRRAGKI